MGEIIQNSIEWHQQRRGKITSSEVYRLMTEPKNKSEVLSDGAKTYIHELVAERLGIYQPDIETEAMRWGKEFEELAKVNIQRRYANIVIKPSGFIESDKIPSFGGSPDGISYEHVHEIKCPFNTANHVQYSLIRNVSSIPKPYYWQIVSNAYLSKKDWAIFTSFDPRIDHDCGLFTYVFAIDPLEVERMLNKVRSAFDYMTIVMSMMGIENLLLTDAKNAAKP